MEDPGALNRPRKNLVLRCASGLLRLPALLAIGLWKSPRWTLRAVWWCIRMLGRILRWGFRILYRALRFLCQWLGNGFLLFASSSRRLFSASVLVIVAVALYVWLFFGWQVEANPMRVVLPPALVLTVLFSMNVLPREREDQTVEVFFSLPVRRFRLVIWHLVTIAVWLFLFLLVPAIFTAPVHSEVGLRALLVQVYPSLLCISCLTLWISTFTRNGPAAGFVAGLVCLLHLFYFPAFGPIRLFPSPFLAQAAKWGGGQAILVLVLAALFIVLTNERLKKSELWFR